MLTRWNREEASSAAESRLAAGCAASQNRALPRRCARGGDGSEVSQCTTAVLLSLLLDCGQAHLTDGGPGH
jgi:hypothetical protein